jgi:hypothetical protein
MLSKLELSLVGATGFEPMTSSTPLYIAPNLILKDFNFFQIIYGCLFVTTILKVTLLEALKDIQL